jgi:hypothetical protein
LASSSDGSITIASRPTLTLLRWPPESRWAEYVIGGEFLEALVHDPGDDGAAGDDMCPHPAGAVIVSRVGLLREGEAGHARRSGGQEDEEEPVAWWTGASASGDGKGGREGR